MNREWLWGFVLFARAILFGAALGLYYEFFRCLRVLFYHPAWLVAAEDLLFFLPATAAHAFFHFAYGEGETRWFGVLGVVLGFLLYLASAGKLLRKAEERLKAWLDRVLFGPIKRRRAARLEERKRRREAARRIRKQKRTRKKARETEE